MPDPVVVLLCALAACLGAFPLARAIGLVGLLSSREKRLEMHLAALAQACSALAGEGKNAENPVPGPVIPVFRHLVAMLASVLERRLPAYETFAAASVEADEWVAGRRMTRSIPLLVCRAGPAIGLGTALGALLMMAEVWANPVTLGSGTGLFIGLAVVGCVLCTTVLAAAAGWLGEAERADDLAAGVVIESARMIAAGGTAADVSIRTRLILKPGLSARPERVVRKAA